MADFNFYFQKKQSPLHAVVRRRCLEHIKFLYAMRRSKVSETNDVEEESFYRESRERRSALTFSGIRKRETRKVGLLLSKWPPVPRHVYML
jgi:hypothetical protein